MNNNPSDNSHPPRDGDYYRDRLMHLALREKLGEETPPDLHDKILNSIEMQDVTGKEAPVKEAATHAASPVNRRVRRMWQMERRFWMVLGSAAGGLLLLCAVICQYTMPVQVAQTPDGPPVKRSTLAPVSYPLEVAPANSVNVDLHWPPSAAETFAAVHSGQPSPLSESRQPIRLARPLQVVAVQLDGANPAFASQGLRRAGDTTPLMLAAPETTFACGQQLNCTGFEQATLRAAGRSPVKLRHVVAPGEDSGETAELAPGNALSEDAHIQIDGFRARVHLTYRFRKTRALQTSTFTASLPADASLRAFSFRDQTGAAGNYHYEHTKGPLKRDLIWRECKAVVAPAVETAPEPEALATTATHLASLESKSVPRLSGSAAAISAPAQRSEPVQSPAQPSQRTLQVELDELPAGVLREVTVGYDINLSYDDEDFVLHHKTQLGAGQHGKSNTRVSVQTPRGVTCKMQPPPQTNAGEAEQVVVNYQGQPRVSVRLRGGKTMLLNGEDCFAAAVQPAMPEQAETDVAAHAIFLLDTSLSSSELYAQRLQLIQQILDQNRGQIRHFAVLMFNIEQHWWQQQFTPNTPADVQQMLSQCQQRLHEGATDLRQALQAAANPAWVRSAEMPPVDLFLLSDGQANWGETNMQQIAAPVRSGNVRALFAFDHGEGDNAALHTLTSLTRGFVIPAATPQQLKQAGVAYRQRPWEIVDVSVQGGRDILLPGGRQMLAAGERLLITGRNQIKPDAELTVKLQRGKELFVHRCTADAMMASELPGRIFAQSAVEQLASVKGPREVIEAFSRTANIGAGAASFVLPLHGASSTERQPAAELQQIARNSVVTDQIKVAKLQASRRAATSRDFFAGCLERASQVSGLGYEPAADLMVAVRKLPPIALETSQAPLNCELQMQSDAPPEFAKLLAVASKSTSSFAEAVRREAQRRRGAGADDALRALSTLVEQNPQDIDLQIDVAHEVMNWGAAENVYPALKRLLVQRPADPRVYHALARCGWQLGRSDIAIICYEVLAGANWPQEYGDVRRAAQAEYLHLLKRIRNRRCDCYARAFAMKRLEEFNARLPFQNAELVVTAWWNNAADDVNLLVSEPGGELCYFDNRLSRNGGWLSKDATQRGGPEIYVLKDAAPGEYQIDLHCRPSESGRKATPGSSVYISAYAGFATTQHEARYRTIKLSPGEERNGVLKVFVDGRGGVSFDEAAGYSSP